MRVYIALGLASLFLWHSAGLRAGETAPIEAFGAIPHVSDVDLSPDGTLLAWHDEGSSGAHVVMFDLNTQKTRRVIPMAQATKVRALKWADNETLLITVSAFATLRQTRAVDHYEVFRTLAADVGGGKDRLLLMRGGAREYVTAADLLAWRTPKPKTVIMSSWDFSVATAQPEVGTRLSGHRRDSGWLSQVFEVDTRTGEGRRIEAGTQFTEGWVVDKDGNVVSRSEWDPKRQIYSIFVKQGLAWRNLLREENRGRRVVHGLTQDGTAIVLSAADGQGHVFLEALPLDGSKSKVLLADPVYDVSNVTYDRFTRSPVSAVLGGLEELVHWFDPEAERQYRSVATIFPGKNVYVYSRSENNQRVLASVEGPSSPPVYYVVDFSTHKADIIGEAYPQLANVALGEVRSITYKARDGSSVPAYLTIPPGASGKSLALVVLPHGGPEDRDSYAFDWWAQFLAVRGYAVLQPQFRGSTGFGEAWRGAGYRQWGGLMQDDVTDGVKALIDQGIADAQRICIVGGSYGGYAALAGAAFTPDLYRCAVSVNGVSDLPQMLMYEKLHEGEESDAVAYWRDHIGAAFDPHVAEISPLNAAANVKASVLLMHAVDDTVVSLQQSESMAIVLGRLGKKVKFVKLAGEDHWLSQTATRVQVLKEIEGFLEASLRKQP